MPLKKPELLTSDSIQTLNILVYGKQGIGKTSFAATAADVPEMRDVLVLNIEGGLMSVNERENKVFHYPIEETKEIDEVFVALLQQSEGFDRFRTVVVDSATALQDMFLAEQDKRAGRTADDRQPKDWGKAGDWLKVRFKAFRDLDINTIFTALYREEFEGDFFNPGPLKEVVPQLIKSGREPLMAFQDFVFMLYGEPNKETKTLDRYAVLEDYRKVRAKCRNDRVKEAFGTLWKDPNIVDLYKVWKGGGTAEEESAA